MSFPILVLAGGILDDVSIQSEPIGLLEELQRFYERISRQGSRTDTGLLDGDLPLQDSDGEWKRPEPGLGLRLDFLHVRIGQAAPWPSTHCARNIQFLLLLGVILEWSGSRGSHFINDFCFISEQAGSWNEM